MLYKKNIIPFKHNNSAKIYYVNEKGHISDERSRVESVIISDFNTLEYQPIKRPVRKKLAEEDILNKKIENSLTNVFKKYLEPSNCFVEKSGRWNPTIEFMNDPNTKENTIKLLLKVLHDVTILQQVNRLVTIEDVMEQLFKPTKLITNKYYFPMLQHILREIYHNYNFKPELLQKITKYLINYEQFFGQNITMLQICEANIYRQTLLAEDNGQFIYIAQDPAYCDYDVKGSLNTNKVNDIIAKKINGTKTNQHDVKLLPNPEQKLSSTSGFLSLTDNLNITSLMNRLKGDLGRILKEKTNSLAFNEKLALQEYKNTLEGVIKDNTLSLKEKLEHYKIIRQNINLDDNIKNGVCTYIVEIPPDKLFTEFYNELLAQGFDHTNIIVNTPKLFQSTDSDPEAWKELLLQIIKALPDKAKEEVLTITDVSV